MTREKTIKILTTILRKGGLRPDEVLALEYARRKFRKEAKKNG